MTAKSQVESLTDFLAARLAEDEAYGPRPLEPGEYPNEFEGHEPGAPARVLREVEAKRRRLERYIEAAGHDLAAGVYDNPAARVLEGEVREDAAVYSDHPDYRQEWAP